MPVRRDGQSVGGSIWLHGKLDVMTLACVTIGLVGYEFFCGIVFRVLPQILVYLIHGFD